MKKYLSILYVVALNLLVSCASSTTTTPTTEKVAKPTVQLPKKVVVEKTVTNNPNTIEFNFLQLNDVYEIAPIQAGKYGGMARVTAVHRALLEENPNTMMVLAGDFLNPSLLGTVKVDGERLRGKQMIDVMNYMNFDIVAFGNHEFDLSFNDLQKRLNESNFEWISSNITHYKSGRNFFFNKIVNGKKHPINDTFIQELIDVDGTKIKIGFISVCIPSNPKNYVSYGDMFLEAKRAYNELKSQVDIVFGLTHVTINQDIQLAQMLPNIPLIMGGHEHTNHYKKIGNTIVAKADANAKTVYIHRIVYHKLTGKTTVKSELKEINNLIAPNKEVRAVVDKWQKILHQKIKEIVAHPDEVIYTTSVALDARDTPIRSIQTNMGEVITRSMSFAFNNEVDCALVNGGSIRIDDELSGDITAVDIFKVLPYGGAILKVDIKGNLLKKVLDFGVKSANTGAYLQRYNVYKKGGEWHIQNLPINNTKIYKVAFSDYLLKGFDIPFLSDKNADVIAIYRPSNKEIASDIRKAVVRFLKSKK